MTIEDNKRIAQRWLMDLWSKGNLDITDQVLATVFFKVRSYMACVPQ